MSEAILEPTLESLHGKLSKNSDVIFRRKTPQVTGKRAISCGPQEAYIITKPRDWKKNPPRGAELEKINRFREACRLTSEQLNNPETRVVWEQRFNRQLHYADPESPQDPSTGRRKVYTQLWAYTRAAILRQLQNDAQNTQPPNQTANHKTITRFPQ